MPIGRAAAKIKKLNRGKIIFDTEKLGACSRPTTCQSERQPERFQPDPAQEIRDHTSLRGEHRHAQIPDRDLHRKKRCGEDRSKDPSPGQTHRNDPGQQKSNRNLNRNGDDDIDQGNEQAVPKSAVVQHVYKVLESDISRDATTEHVVCQTIVDCRKKSEKNVNPITQSTAGPSIAYLNALSYLIRALSIRSIFQGSSPYLTETTSTPTRHRDAPSNRTVIGRCRRCFQ